MTDLRDLFHEAVDPIEPRPGLDAIRARTAEAEPHGSRRWIAPVAAAAAVAAVVGGFLTLQGRPSSSPEVPPASHTTGAPSPSPSTSGHRAVPVYYLGTTTSGVRLFREFHTVASPTDSVLAALEQAVSGRPKDPDYRTPWPSGTTVRGVQLGSLITVTLTGPVTGRPTGMDAETARIAIQQLVYTAQAAYGKGRVPVRFIVEDQSGGTVLGEHLGIDPVPAAAPLQTLSHVNLTTPTQGQVITGGTLTVSGVANSFEADVVIRLQRYEGTYIAFQKPVTASGWQADRLFPFQATFDLSGVTPGTYTLMAMTDDPSGQGRSFSDDKVIQVR